MYTLNQKITAIERELGKRKNFYPQWVQEGRMRQDQADHEIGVMAAILEDYKLKDPSNNFVQRGLFQ